MKDKDTCIIIPARFKSSRFPGKPLINLLGKPMIIRVAELACKVLDKKDVYIATDNDQIKEVVNRHGYQFIKTEKEALTGTDRVALAANKLNYKFFINIQGDEPLIDPKDIQKCISLKKKFPNNVLNGYCFINKNEDPRSVNIPKLVTDKNDNLIYISRSIIPSNKDKILIEEIKYKKQVCIYGFTRSELNRFIKLCKKSYLEKIEDIEILRFLELEMKVKMFKCQDDVKKVEKALLNKLNN